MKHTQKWFCKYCDKGGVVEYDERAGVHEVFNAIEDDHARVSTYCQAGISHIQVENTEHAERSTN